MPLSSRRILATSALPYANGPIHIGHLVEYIQTDIWVRSLRMQGHETYYIGADDTHGTPVMLRAQREGLTPQALIERIGKEHKRDFDDFGISFDHYGSTNSPANKLLSEQVYHALQQAGLIETREIEQAYDARHEMFLPDRFIKGGCPKCGAADQYGDACEVCGSTYSPMDLVKPYSVLSNEPPIRKRSVHYFFCLSNPRCESFLREWVTQLAQPEALNKMREWLGPQEASPSTESPSASELASTEDASVSTSKLNDWDISRDAPYFGFEIPDAPGKYFYVWLDAPLGYYASFKEFCDARGLDFAAWVAPESTTEQYHFIGKDILYFHTLFWPAMLHFSGHRTPTNVFAHGFLTVNGQKMSKSRGTFITAQSYIDAGLNPEWLRYYLAAKLNSSLEDIDLNWEDFVARVNSDLIGKYLNIASRTANFIVKHFDARIDDTIMQHPLLVSIRAAIPEIIAQYEARENARAIRTTLRYIDMINAFIDENKPWEQAKVAFKGMPPPSASTDALDTQNASAHLAADPQQPSSASREASIHQLHQTCSISLEAFRLFTLAFKPVLPQLAQNAEAFLQIPPLTWADIDQVLTSNQPIRPYSHLMTRVDMKCLDSLLENAGQA